MWTILISSTFLLILFIANSFATIVIPMTDEDIVRNAAIILKGTVTNITSEWTSDHTQIQTHIDISVDSLLKGSLPDNNITLRFLGGTVGDTTLLIVDSPSFAPNQEVMLFLKANYISLFSIVGFNQGKLTIETDPNTGQKIIKEKQVLLDDFLSSTREIIDGQK